MAHAVTPIPAACITTEDSDFFARMAARNISVRTLARAGLQLAP